MVEPMVSFEGTDAGCRGAEIELAQQPDPGAARCRSRTRLRAGTSRACLPHAPGQAWRLTRSASSGCRRHRCPPPGLRRRLQLRLRSDLGCAGDHGAGGLRQRASPVSYVPDVETRPVTASASPRHPSRVLPRPAATACRTPRSPAAFNAGA